MSNDSTGKTGGLSLAERAKQGLLLSEPYLDWRDVLFLECDAEQEKYKAFNRVLNNAIQFGDVKTRNDVKNFRVVRTVPDHDVWMLGCVGDRPTKQVIENRPVTTVLIERESYRAWRAQCPKSLLSEFSKIEKWLGATPVVETLPPAEPSIPETTAKPVAIGVNLRPDQQDKRDCQQIARELWAEHPEWIQADLLKHPRIKSYVTQWKPKTVPGWLSEVDPRPKERRRGRPKTR